MGIRIKDAGWSSNRSTAPQTKRVEVMGVLGNLATCRDSFGVTHTIRTDVLRYKGAPPKAGEIWYIDRMLGAWHFQAIAGFTQGAGSDLVRRRKTATYTTGALSALETEAGFITLAPDFRVLTVATNAPARVRLYARVVDQQTDMERAASTDPTPGVGIIMDFVTADVLLSSPLAPIPEGANLESPPRDSIPISVTSVNGGPITVTLTWVAEE